MSNDNIVDKLNCEQKKKKIVSNRNRVDITENRVDAAIVYTYVSMPMIWIDCYIDL